MNFRNYNDYEIISLMKQGSEEAFELMVEKYKLFIAKKIGKFNLGDDYDDCLQEGIILLYKSAIKFKEVYNKTFTRYFEGNLENRFISICRTKSRYNRFMQDQMMISASFKLYEPAQLFYSKKEMEEAYHSFSCFEKEVFDQKFTLQKTTEEIALNLNCPIKKVYNAIDRIRQKLKMHLE